MTDHSYHGSRRYWVQTARTASGKHKGYSVCCIGPSGLTIRLRDYFFTGQDGHRMTWVTALARANSLADYLNEGGKL
jgi:hypothetical protein